MDERKVGTVITKSIRVFNAQPVYLARLRFAFREGATSTDVVSLQAWPGETFKYFALLIDWAHCDPEVCHCGECGRPPVKSHRLYGKDALEVYVMLLTRDIQTWCDSVMRLQPELASVTVLPLSETIPSQSVVLTGEYSLGSLAVPAVAYQVAPALLQGRAP